MRTIAKLTAAAILSIAAMMPASASARQLYTNLYTDGTIAAFNVGGDGTLAPIAGSPYDTPGFPQMIAITPDARFIVSGFPFMTENFLIPYAIGPAGEVGTAGAQLNTPLSQPMVISPNGSTLFAPMDDNSVGTFAIAADGALSAQGTAGNTTAEDLAVTPDGRYLFAGDFSTATVSRFSISAAGGLTELTPATVQSAGVRTTKITPDGRYLIVTTDPGVTGSTASYLIGGDGSLTATGQSVPNIDTSVDHGAMTPNGQFLYLPNGNDNSVSTVQIGPNGELSQPHVAVPTALANAGEAVVSPDGRFLFVQSRNGDFMQTFAIAANGLLTPITPAVATGGTSDGSRPTPRPAQAPITKLKVKGAEPGQLSRFDATGSADTDGGSVTGYSWNFGDGTKTTSTGPKVSHRYKSAGDYDVSAYAIDNENCGGADIFDGNIMYCNASAESTANAKLDTPPAITKLRVSPKRFRARKGTRFLYTLSERARVTFTVQKPTVGRKVGKSCRKTSSKNRNRKRCVRYVKVKNGTIRANGKRGSNKFKFSGKLKKRSLARGKYRLSVTAVDSKRGRSIAKTTRFTVR